MEFKEHILCAAIWINDGIIHDAQPDNIDIGYTICGRRHHNCYQTITDLKGDCNTYLKTLNLLDDDYRKHQGFMTSHDRFVDRKEGWKIAVENNQVVIGLAASDNGEESILISENLY